MQLISIHVHTPEDVDSKIPTLGHTRTFPADTHVPILSVRLPEASSVTCESVTDSRHAELTVLMQLCYSQPVTFTA